jgi:hypothetical protein
VDKILDYQRALGQIFGALAASGKTGWGSTNDPTTALSQLERAFNVARRIDEEAERHGESHTTRIDPDLAVLYAQGLEASGTQERVERHLRIELRRHPVLRPLRGCEGWQDASSRRHGHVLEARSGG